ETRINVALEQPIALREPLQLRRNVNFDRILAADRGGEEHVLGNRSLPMAAAKHAPEPAPILAATTAEREPRIDFHEQVRPGEMNRLVVAMDPTTAQSVADTIALTIGAGRETVDLTVQLFAPGFDVQPSDVMTLTVGRTFDAAREQVAFDLTAKTVAHRTRREITADFSIAGISIGGVVHVTWVVLPGEAHEDREPPFQPVLHLDAAARCGADLKIIVSDKGDGKLFSVRVTSALAGFVVESKDVGELKTDDAGTTSFIATSLGKTFQARPVLQLIQAAERPAAIEAWNRKLLAKLVEVGTQLWEWLPESFRDIYFLLHDRGVAPKSIHVMSDDMLFPWELVIPWRNAGGRRDMLAPLGTAHVIGRWRPGLFIKPEPQRYPVKKIAIVNPSYPPGLELPESEGEAADLKNAFGTICELVKPCNLETVKSKVLDGSDVQLFHFTGHANFEKMNANESFLALEDGEELTAGGLGAAAFTAGAPIVVLNACSVGDSGLVASRAGGFAERCLQTGCSAVLAAYWPVADGAARTFSVAFYEKLRRGRAFGEALQELRLEREDDPTYHAYTFFGDPLARLVF
ncbi:MAG: hypothetical protein JWO56_2718, partial [Acidobacteria bacterium]|nr:hypothetical protein [Acidobacteriota bacterium]